MLVEAEGAGRVPPQLGWQGPAGRVRLLVQAPPPHPSPWDGDLLGDTHATATLLASCSRKARPGAVRGAGPAQRRRQ